MITDKPILFKTLDSGQGHLSGSAGRDRDS